MHARAVERFGQAEVDRRLGEYVDGIVRYYDSLTSPYVTVRGLLSYAEPKSFTEMAVADYEARHPEHAAVER
jgi:hypothetical protein